ncbi:MAG: hypothetical protein PHN88_02555 [Ignavibacteria bacterium]|nr:hypothetical protein [Ignavibacteria bacterium]
MIKVIRQEIFTKDAKTYLVKVIFDGENYIASGYVNNILINETKQPLEEFNSPLEADSPEIDNLIVLIKDDIIDSAY